MKKTIWTPLLTILVAAALLLGASFALQSIASTNAQKEHLWILQTLLPGSSDFVVEPYAGEDAIIRSVHKADNGFVIETVTYGYAGEITMLIGVNKEGKVTGLVIRDMQETFGLGAKALNDHAFLAQFLNTAGDVSIRTNAADAFSAATGTITAEGTHEVDGITGATVTSKAIARCVNAAVAYVTGADVDSGATSWGG